MGKSLRLFQILYLYICLIQTMAEYQEAGDASESNVDFVHLRINVNCTDRDNVYEKKLHSNYWTLINYIRADNKNQRCSTSVTYTTHGDYRYLNNVVELVMRWQAPISLALYAPGSDFKATVFSILWLQQCHPQRKLIRQWVNFHIYFDVNHKPKVVYTQRKLLQMKLKCGKKPPFAKRNEDAIYRNRMQLVYPVNVGRNIAKEASPTHYILASDIELYPTPGLVQGFLRMLIANRKLLKSKKRIAFPLNIFEIEKNVTVPINKMELKWQLSTGQAVPFHAYVCPDCNMGPTLTEWITHYDASNTIRIFSVNRRVGHWDPVYIGTTQEPPYDERFSWEGMTDKQAHSFVLCLMGYEFHTLDNAFLVHKPGIKMFHYDQKRKYHTDKTNQRIRSRFSFEYLMKYGSRTGCIL